jgi:hypothetical protein
MPDFWYSFSTNNAVGLLLVINKRMNSAIHTIDYDTLHMKIREIYKLNPDGMFFFDFDNVLYNANTFQSNPNIREAVCSIPLRQRRILTARSSRESLSECLSVSKAIGYDFTGTELISGGFNKDLVLEKASSDLTACESCRIKKIFFFDDNVMNIFFADERKINNLEVYWVDHYPSHKRMCKSLETRYDSSSQRKLRKTLAIGSDSPFLMNDASEQLVYRDVLTSFLTESDISTRMLFYHS